MKNCFWLLVGSSFCSLFFVAHDVHGAIDKGLTSSKETISPKSLNAEPEWKLGEYLSLSSSDPKKIMALALKMFHPDRLRISAIEASYAFDWRSRLAMVQALSDIFDPGAKRSKETTSHDRQQARKILVLALNTDPALVVRDAVVESIRRIVRMRPQERLVWKKPLEEAFMSQQSVEGGEGFFIRETILTALYEASLPLSPKIKKAALKDKNVRVRNLLSSWSPQAHQQL
jgi:hypothetical protein